MSIWQLKLTKLNRHKPHGYLKYLVEGLRPRTHSWCSHRRWEASPSTQRFGVMRDPGRWPSLICCSSLPHDRIESELPKPTSPKISRSPTETAVSPEDMTRKSKLAAGQKGQRVGIPSPLCTPPERLALDRVRSSGFAARHLDPASSLFLGQVVQPV